MHPTAAALALRGYQLVRYTARNRGFACILQGRNDPHAYAYDTDREEWRSTFARLMLDDPQYEEIAWSEIPDSLWATCDLEEAVRVLES